ncbi:cation/H(+) antiporter [Sphingobacterium sp. DK4209]|uniref:Cation/H(+) antiporter n=1 Tax=Sphingobacterium zhuxiongii TaxID=2662364 RepID=A0A5Q0QGC7_9SPHI|nr:MULTISPECIES: cation:proton antiporter [unclassified Sphingobacterium]MVZ67036.1 cation/H(+) antiporter [Sphingobacterium sp. DK4209]QGA26672.1 cation/H(+) antiporter [Sphingobacterium sp. dk4302]
MKKLKSSIFYIGIVGGFSFLIYWIISQGRNMEIGRDIQKINSGNSQWQEFLSALIHNLQHPLAILLAQIIVIILFARLFGWLFKKIGQPTVIGEIIAGIILGPSFLGMYFPDFSAALFPTESLGNLQFLSQIGLILFMFVVGMELDLKVLQNKAHDAVVISHASIILPFALGVSLAYFIYGSFAPAGIDFTSFALFIGISMSITAFPVLARIVQERNIQKTKLGTIVITCAAADDITAWCLLAAVIAIVKAGNFLSSLYIIALAIAYVFVMIKFVRPFLKRIGDMHDSRENLSKPVVAIFFLTLIISSYLTEVIGIHALFGAFMAGAIMPENAKFRNVFIEKVEDVALVLLLPLFFVFTGLRTQIGLLNEPYLWQITGWIILVAVVGKFVGSAIAAKFMGQNWKDSLTIGALMNTRGLMELIVLNIGFDLGVLNAEMFAMLVLMALITTFMTGPAIDLFNKLFKSTDSLIPDEISRIGKYNLLISFGNPLRGPSLLRLAHGLVKESDKNSSITAMHLTPTNDLHQYNAEDYEIETFEPIVTASKELSQSIITLFKASNNMEADIAEIANEGNYDLLLIGVGQSIYEGSVLGRILGFTTRFINPENLVYRVKATESLLDNSVFSNSTLQIMGRSKIPVAVLIDKDFKKLDHILFIVYSKSDLELLPYIQKFIHNAQSQVTIIDMNQYLQQDKKALELFRSIEQVAPNHITKIEGAEINMELTNTQDLVMLSKNSWKELFSNKEHWIINLPSTLIIKQ